MDEIQSWRTINNAPETNESRSDRIATLDNKMHSIFEHLREAVRDVMRPKRSRDNIPPPLDPPTELPSLVDSWMKYSPNLLDDPTCDPPEQPQHPIPIHLKTSSHLIMQAHPISTPPPPTREPDSSWHQWAMQSIPTIINHLRQHHNLSYTTNRKWSSYTPPSPIRIRP